MGTLRKILRPRRVPFDLGPMTWPWLLFLLLALLPVALRTELDLASQDRLAVLSIYRDWRWSGEGRSLKPGDEVVFAAGDERGPPLAALFKSQLQRDFRVSEVGNGPRVRAFFDSSSIAERLRARIEIADAQGMRAWSGEAVRLGNGWMLGPWVALVLFVFGQPLALTLACHVLVTALWLSHWSPLDIPSSLLQFVLPSLGEIVFRFRENYWNASELGRLPALGALLYFVPRLTAQVWSRAGDPRVPARRARWLVLASFAVEPLAVWTGSLFGQWSADAAWWKVYLGSFAYRFIALAFVAAAFFRPEIMRLSALSTFEPLPRVPKRVYLALALTPLLFIAANGWSWMAAALSYSTGESLFRLKVFGLGWLLATATGSRVFSLWLGTLALAVTVPPSTGHWNAAHQLAFLLDGMLVGWWMSPLKALRLRDFFHMGLIEVAAVAGLALVVGTFLSSVGVPLGLCWLSLVLALWAYSQAVAPDRHPKEEWA
jgi:hypothetical protein